MTKKEYFEEVKKIVQKAISERVAAQAELDGVMDKLNHSKMYSAEHIQNVLRPMRRDLERQIREAADKANIAVEKLTSAYIAELKAQVHLDGASLTEDAQLLSLGVKLRDTDLEKLFDKHAGNFTMQRLICDYASQNDIKIRRTVQYPVGDIISSVERVPYVAGRSVYWHNKPEFYEQVMGENSELARYMNS